MFIQTFRSGMIFVTTATVIQNGLILTGTVLNYADVKRTVPQRAIILSTTMADLIMGLVVMPFGLYFEFNEGAWGLGAVMCDVWISTDILCSTASILSIAFHSMDKYYSLWTPRRYCGNARRNWTQLYVMVTWCLSAFVALSAGASGWARNLNEPSLANQMSSSLEEEFIDLDNFDLHMLMHEQIKAMELPEQCAITTNPMFAIYSAAVSFYLPTVAIVYYSIKIRQLAFMTLEERRRKRLLQKNRKRLSVRRKLSRHKTAVLNAARRAQVSCSRRSQMHGRERQVAILWMLTIFTFLACWAPFFIAHPLSCLGVPIPEEVMMILPWLGYSHSIVNPILHAFLEPDYLKSFVKLIVRCFSKIRRGNRPAVPPAKSASGNSLVEMVRFSMDNY